MKIFLASEFRCTVYKNEYYLAPKAYSIYKRYAEAFGDIVLCSRFEYVDTLFKGYKKADFIYKTIEIDSLLKMLLNGYENDMIREMKSCELVVGRLPSVIGYRAFDCAHKLKIKYMSECMGDAWDSYWNHDLLGKFIAGYMFLKMKRVVKKSDYALYVTENFLQGRYPNPNKTVNVSNVVIDDVSDEILNQRLQKIKHFNSRKISIMTTAGVNVRAKGHKFVIKAMSVLSKEGFSIDYYLAGGGDQGYLKKIASKYNMEEHIHFLGELSMSEVFTKLRDIDIYIQPSLQEGLPRAVIEAMSVGCPCLGSNTAGTPELIDQECIFRRKSANAIVQAIKKISNSDLSIYATNNFERSKLYLADELNKRRNEYFLFIKSEIR